MPEIDWGALRNAQRALLEAEAAEQVPRHKPKPKPRLRWGEPGILNPFAAAAQPVPVPPQQDFVNFILDDFGEMPAPVVRAQPEAPKMDTIPFTERSTRLPRFKMNYQSIEEVDLRLRGSVAMIRDQYVYIHNAGVCTCEETGRRGLGVLVQDATGRAKHVTFETEGMNLRTPDPGYVDIDGVVYYLQRPPVRVYKQGLTGENTLWWRVYDGSRRSVFGAHSMSAILKGLNDRPVIQWSADLMPEGMKAVRLSDRIAVKRWGKGFQVMYRNRQVGPLFRANQVKKLNGVVPSEWIIRALSQVGLEIEQ